MSTNFQSWRKSSHSAPNGDCVEVCRFPIGDIGVRDSKQKGTGPVLVLTRREWGAFVRDLRSST